MLDFLVVGAGLTGATFARLAVDNGALVKVIEKRQRAGGLCMTQIIYDKLPMCLFSGHIFHTNDEQVWKFVNRFAEWYPYEHRVKANYQGKVYSFPVNRMTLSQIGDGDPIQMFYKEYSEKQWGIPWEEVPPEVKNRVRFRDSYDDRYFTDRHQAMPDGGYTPFVDAMLRGIEVDYGYDYLENVDYWNSKAKRVIYTGALDRLMGDALPYRTSTFDHQEFLGFDPLGCATMNYTGKEVAYSRIIGHQHFYHMDLPRVTISYETHKPCSPSEEPFYPIPTEENIAHYQKIRAQAAERYPTVVPAGRLGTYRYINMDQAIALAMELWREQCAPLL